MSEQDVRTFAVACGWRNLHDTNGSNLLWGTPPEGTHTGLIGHEVAVPDFPHDLSACVEALECAYPHYTLAATKFVNGKPSYALRIDKPLQPWVHGFTKQEAIVKAVTAAAKARPR